MNKRIIATSAAVVAVVAGGTFTVAGPAQADVERSGTCAGAAYELSVDRERGGFEVDADLDRARAGSAWRISLRHDGKVIHSRTHNADAEGEIDFDVRRRDTAGKDTFVLEVRPVGGSACSTRVTLR